jgi:hypothetical protein
MGSEAYEDYRFCASPTGSHPVPWPVTVGGPVRGVGNLQTVAHAAREVQSTVQWPGAGA